MKDELDFSGWGRKEVMKDGVGVHRWVEEMKKGVSDDRRE